MRIFVDLALASNPNLDLIAGVQRFATTRSDWQILVPGWDGEREDLIALADGALIRDPQHALVSDASGTGLRRRCVLISGTAVPGLPRVWHDEAAIATTASDYLIGLGFRHFLLRDDRESVSLHDRMTRFAVAAARAAIGIVRYDPDQAMRRHYTVSAETDRLREALEALPSEHWALIAYDSLTARRLQNSLQSLGRLVPDDLAVFALEDRPIIATAVRPPISAVRIDHARLGYTAAQQLHRLLGRARPDRLVAIPPRGIVERGSADRITVIHDPVAIALRLIREAPERPWPVDDLAARVGTSRRALERAFRHELGRSPAAEVSRIRLEHAAILVANETVPIADIAQRCGFSSHSRFCHAFRRQYHCTPQRYRLQAPTQE